MTASDPHAPARFRLLASLIAGRALEIAEASTSEAAFTNGAVIFVTADTSAEQRRREVVVQSSLLGAGSLEHRLVKALRARPSVARRYLTLEGRRALGQLGERLPLAAALPIAPPSTTTPEESLEIARGRTKIDEPPDWFGAINPGRLLVLATGPGSRATHRDLRLQFDPVGALEDDDEAPSEESKILKLFESPVVASRALSNILRKLFGGSPSAGDDAAGGQLQVGSVRRAHDAGAVALPLPRRIHFSDDGKPGAAVGVGGALYPEWDVHHNSYRSQWCRVIDFPLTAVADVSDADVQLDDVLWRRLSRIGLGLKVLRARADGDELDIEALIELSVDLRSGYSSTERVYLERRKLARDLGVLILLDASGSATDTDPKGLAVHDHQRRAAATLAVTLEELGDRVAVYAFSSQGRHAVHLPAIKAFGQRFGATGRARLNQLQPSGYTRLGAAIRGAGEILKSDAGTPNRLLLVLSDGFPYDDGYEGRYAEADVSRSLEELRTDGVGCLCLSIGAAPDNGALERVFGSAGYASAPTLGDLSPQMDELFLSALMELAAPIRR
ncbi:MAG TPA: VWA domain-containing protein [Mycobacterium sp.]|nr:VWA domain-containing protein [Mycobacterium sp.]